MDQRNYLPYADGFSQDERCAPALKFNSVLGISDCQTTGDGGVVVERSDVACGPFSVPETLRLQISKPRPPEPLNFRCRREDEYLLGHDESAWQMEIGNDGLQVEITEIPEITYEKLVDFLFEVGNLIPLNAIVMAR